MSMCKLAIFSLVALAIAPAAAQARIKLAALPQRERVEIQLDDPRFTLVEEERIVPLLQSTPQRGNNMIDFSWSNTAIDKDSIQFRPIGVHEGEKFRAIGKADGNDEVAVVSVAYPPGENALVWEVFAAKACAVKVRVSYRIMNLSRSFSYRALANKDEKTLTLRNFLEVSNTSGENFGNAQVWAGFGPQFLKPVDQPQEIKMLLEKFDNVPIDKTYTFDWYSNGPLDNEKPLASRVLMHYVLLNDEKHEMGKFPLQDGKVRIFVADAHGGEAFLGEDMAQLTPLDEKMKLYLGQARDVVCTRKIVQDDRSVIQGNLFNREMTIRYEIEEFQGQAHHAPDRRADEPHRGGRNVRPRSARCGGMGSGQEDLRLRQIHV